MAIAAVEWDQTTDNIQWIVFERYLIQSGSEVKITTDGVNLKTVGRVPVTEELFKSDGMYDLTLFYRKPTEFTYNMVDNGALGSGKVFKSTIDLSTFVEPLRINVR